MSQASGFKRRAAALVAAGTAVALGGLAGLAPPAALASSHREAPLISGQPQYDNTDTYAFVSPDKPDTTTLVANWVPFEDPAGGPNFYRFATDAKYDIHIDNDGDAKADLTYRWTFKDHYRNGNTFLYNTGPVTSLNDPDLNFRQTYNLDLIFNEHSGSLLDLRLLVKIADLLKIDISVLLGARDGKTLHLIKNAPVAPSNVGTASMPNYEALRNQAVVSKGKAKSFTGQADDSFFLDLRVFDLLYGGDLSEVGNDSLKGYNVNTVALQVPSKLLIDRDSVVGVWSSTSREDGSGRDRQVSRLGMPLVNEVVIPVKDKDRFNASKPKDDAQFGKYVTNPELPKLIQAVYGIPAPKEPRNDLVQVFLTGVPSLNQPKNVKASEQLRLNTAIKPAASPKRLGVLEGDTAGFPNGRRLTDDVVDIALQVVEGELVGAPNDLGDAVNANDKAFGKTFPYVALPHSGSVVKSAVGKPGSTPLNGGAIAGGTSGGTSDGSGLLGTPLVSLSAVALGGLAIAGGLFLYRRNRGSVATA
ncbi:DUF4331 domain-containing protein [Tenggerimyces flavus]|uniref:DUF4331 domain-containing protein n=1 Tax=Tenggerimyces flavus TaxID=1708749 RepID=A0ABV7Y9E8_9ACTN|nr:DUF4331 domain-containing protein [Tenggerimyces flavus]MBM7789737.1 hypothetical protein [Tenggerimyces flavus]